MPFETIRSWHIGCFALEVAEALQRAQRVDADRWAEEGLRHYPSDPILRSSKAAVLLKSGRPERAREILLQMLPATDQPEEHQAILWNNIAWANLLINSHESLEEADAFSGEAFEFMPWKPHVKGTRGSVLVALGRVEEGVALLSQAVNDQYSPSDKASVACFLAIAANRNGDKDEESRYVEMARSLDPDNCLLARFAE